MKLYASLCSAIALSIAFCSTAAMSQTLAPLEFGVGLFQPDR